MKVLRQGYYWPTVKEDAANFVRACNRCQCFANYSSMPATLLMLMVNPWQFSIWGVDLIGELPKAKGDVKYAVVAVDYFTKWAEPRRRLKNLSSILSCADLEFLTNLSLTIESSKIGGAQRKLAGRTLKSDVILQHYSEIYYGGTPFMLTYNYEAMVPVEVGSGSLRRDRYTEENAEINQRLHLDLLEEARENSQLRLTAYKQRAARYYNKKIKGQLLKETHPDVYPGLLDKKVEAGPRVEKA
ncbi:uncharacterized protein LOC141719161 [Apium graveolens]|uniref:uncharacterized protein LOC141719161 n=1 Tax=Apium graveolens TaxID=4045 RepID=UPI003D7B2885